MKSFARLRDHHLIFFNVDIDECDEGTDNCHANATCTNNAGGFTCACDPYFDGDGYSCERKNASYCLITFDNKDQSVCICLLQVVLINLAINKNQLEVHLLV